MIQQVPALYTREAMLLELRMISGDVFDFFYMPSQESVHENRGYAIVNFPEPLDAMNCIAALSGRKYSFVTGAKGQAFEVVAAKLQGLEANMEDAFYDLGGFNVPGKEDTEPLVMINDQWKSFEEAMKELYPDKYVMLLKSGAKSLYQLTTDESCNEEQEDEYVMDEDSESEWSGSDDFDDDSSGSGSDGSGLSSCDPSVINSFRVKFAQPSDHDASESRIDSGDLSQPSDPVPSDHVPSDTTTDDDGAIDDHDDDGSASDVSADDLKGVNPYDVDRFRARLGLDVPSSWDDVKQMATRR
jgi:hypothetical protein